MKKFTTLLLTTILFGGAFAQNTWTTEKIMQYKNITGTNISPDGKHIAYVVRVPFMEGEKSEYNDQIWIAAVMALSIYNIPRVKNLLPRLSFLLMGNKLHFFPTGLITRIKCLSCG